MNIVCVSGGSYKSFYINHFIKMKKCDLLIFNFDIIYDYIVKDELLKDAIVTKELLMLSNKLKTIVVAGVYVINNMCKRKSLLICNGDQIEICSMTSGAKIFIGKKCFIIGDDKTKYGKENKIILTKKSLFINTFNCAKNKIYIFCHAYGTKYVVNKKLKRKFNKYSKIILK